MSIKRVMGIETEYGLSGIDAYTLVSAYDNGKKHYNKGETNNSLLPEMMDFRQTEGDYALLRSQSYFYPGYYQELHDETLIKNPSYKTEPVHTDIGKTDRMLLNGARFYVDMGHPEYSTPECSNPLDLVIHDKAGEMILNETRKRRNPFMAVQSLS